MTSVILCLMKINENFITTDFCLASALLSNKHHLIELDKSNPRRIGFVFSKSSKLNESIDSFRFRHLKITPQDFYQAQRELKSLMYQEDTYAS